MTLIATTPKTFKRMAVFWFSLSLTFSAFYAGLALQQAFRDKYVVQDDAREYLIWMQRFSDADLLPQDLIADYFKSITPNGYAMLYQLMNGIAISPLLLSKLLPMVLGLLTTSYCFGLCLQLLPIPMAGFISSLLLNQELWIKDDLVSATPRGFLAALLLAFLYYLLRKSWWLACTAILLLGLFYPPGVLLTSGLLLVRLLIAQFFRHSKIHSPLSRRDYLFCLGGLAIAVLVMLPYALNQSQFGPIITATEARSLPEFFRHGRIPFFDDTHPLAFWISGANSGIRISLNPPIVVTAFLLPLLMRYPYHFPLVKRLTNVIILPELVLVSLCWFFTAHAVLLKLFNPSRYTMHSLRIVIALAAGLALSVMWDAAWQRIGQLDLSRFWGRKILAVGAILLVAAVIVFYPNIFWRKFFPTTNYAVGQVPALYEYLQQQPKDTLIASLAEEANNLPIFAQRSILVGREYGLPYHVGYYRQFRERATELIHAQYSPDLAVVKRFMQKYKVSFWLLEQSAFTPKYLATNRWLRQYQPATSEAIANLEQGTIPALAQVMQECSVLQTGGLVVIQAKCISKYT